MKIRFIALCAMTGLCACLNAASHLNAGSQLRPPLAIYYSFESRPPQILLANLEAELARILQPAGVRVAWRPMDHRNAEQESFREVVVMRFRGACSFSPFTDLSGSLTDATGSTLARTELVATHVLPFGEVECNQLKRYIAPAAGGLDFSDGNAALGRAIARVAAHEIYHMLTGSSAHAGSGIARAEHSRADLTAPTFDFAPPETAWLRAWVRGQPESPGLDAQQPDVPYSSASVHLGTR